MAENSLIPAGAASPIAADAPPQETLVDNLLRARQQDQPDPAPERVRLEAELERTRKQLDGQIAANRIARQTASDALGQLKSVEFDTQMVRLELERTRNQLGQSQQLHADVVRQAAAREETFRNDIVAVRAEASKAATSGFGDRKKLLAIPIFVALGALAWAAVAEWHLLDSQGGLRAKAADKPALSESPEPPVSGVQTAGSAPDFVDAVARLDRAMERFGTTKPEDVLRLVRKQGLARGVSVCSFGWNGGQVSLLFGGRDEGDLPTAIIRCAEAVENTSK